MTSANGIGEGAVPALLSSSDLARHCSASIRKEHRLVMSGPLERLFIERPYVARENPNRTSQIFLRQIG